MRVLTEAGIIPPRQRPGGHQAHVSLEHIEQLGELIEAGFSQKPAQPPPPQATPKLDVYGEPGKRRRSGAQTAPTGGCPGKGGCTGGLV